MSRTPEVTPELLAELRTQFAQKLEAGIPNLDGGLHPADAERLKDDSWLKKFLDHQECNVGLAVQMLIESVVWRKSYGTNEISEANINMEYMREGLFYPRGKDIDGYTVLVFKTKKHNRSREFEDLKRCLVYWLERLERIDKCKRISVFFDMAGTGLANMDMEFTKYLINLFKLYYPDFLNYIIIYELPWALQAAFMVIKKLMPAKAVSKMKFLSTSNLKEYMPLDQAQTCWGGQDDYIFSFISEPLVGNYSANQDSNSLFKKVTFADTGMQGDHDQTPDEPHTDDNRDGKSKIQLTPHDCVEFSGEKNDISGTFSLKNIHSDFISFKIKTTSPEKFRVRPSMGVLAPNASQVINLMLLEDYNYSAVSREKFLVMCIDVGVQKSDMTQQEIAELWKNKDMDVERHRLRCSVPRAGLKLSNLNSAIKSETLSRNGIMVTKGNASNMDLRLSEETQLLDLIQNLREGHEALERQLNNLKSVQWISFALAGLLLGLIVYFYSKIGQNEGNSEFCTMP